MRIIKIRYGVARCKGSSVSEVSPPKPKPSHETIDSLTFEMEVRDLIDRVTVLEEGHTHVHEMQRPILQKQEEILARFTKLDKSTLPFTPGVQFLQ